MLFSDIHPSNIPSPREILEAYKHDKELRCFALIEDDHIEGTEHEVTDIIPPMLYSYICLEPF